MRCPSCSHVNITHFGFCEKCLSILDPSSPAAEALRSPGLFAEEGAGSDVDAQESDAPVRKTLPWLSPDVPEVFMHDTRVRELEEKYSSAAIQGRCERILVYGDPGMGKTRFVREFMHAIEPQPKYIFMADAHDDGAGPLALFRSLLKSRYGIGSEVDPIEAANRLYEEIVALHDVSDPTHDAHLIGFLLGMSVRTSPYAALRTAEQEGLKFMALQALTRLLIRDARQRALLIVVDEYHLASPESRHVISHIYRTLQGHPVWMVLLGRPEMLDTQPEAAEVEHRVDLRPLKPRATQQFVRGLLDGIEEVPAEVVKRVAETSGGNPYAAYHILLYLHEMGVITRDDGAWSIDETSFFDLAIPPTLAGVAAARYQCLNNEEKEHLARAAVVGTRFRLGTVLAIQRAEQGFGRPGGPSGPVPDDVEQTRAVFDDLVRRAFLRRVAEKRVPGEERYEFTSSGERDLLLESLVPERRSRMHRIIAQWHEVNLPDSVPSKHELLASHYEAAGDSRLAARSAISAGKLAAQSFRNDQAIALFERAQRLFGPARSPELIDVGHELGKLYFYTGDLDQSLTCFEGMLDHAWRLRAKRKGAVALEKLSRVRRELGDYDQALRLGLRSLELFRQMNDRNGMASACDKVGQVFWLLGDFPRALAYLQQDARIRRERKDERGLAVALLNISRVYIDTGDLARAARFSERAHALFRRVQDPLGVIGSLNVQAVIALYYGETARGRTLLETGLEEARGIGDRSQEAKILNNLADILAESDLDEAQKRIEQAYKIAKHISDVRGVAGTRFTLSKILALRGQMDEALVVARKGLMEVQTTRHRMMIYQGQISIAEILLEIAESEDGESPITPSLQEAIDILKAALNGLDAIGAPIHLPRTLGMLAKAYEKAGLTEEMNEAKSRKQSVEDSFERHNTSADDSAEG
ncbi:MAG: hypothetical protein CMH54_12650 [Myxococcales bacterium]|nr:hypothetical protein [Myxococcales bacterium]